MSKFKQHPVLASAIFLLVLCVSLGGASWKISHDEAAAKVQSKKDEAARLKRIDVAYDKLQAEEAVAQKVEEKASRKMARRLAKAFCAGDESLFALDEPGVTERTDRLCPGEEKRQRDVIAKEYEEIEANPSIDYDDPMYDSDNEFEFSASDHTCEELRAWYTVNPKDSNLQIARQFFIACGDTPPPVASGEISDADGFFGL